jgi:hypothetical protein
MGDVHVEGAYIRTEHLHIGVNVGSFTFHYQDLECDTRNFAKNEIVLEPVGAKKSGLTTQCVVG